MSKIKLKMGLRLKTTLVMCSSAFILIAALFFYVLPAHNRQEITTLAHYSEQHLQTLSIALVNPILTRQYALLYELMDSQQAANAHWEKLFLELKDGTKIYPLTDEKIELHQDDILIETDIVFLDETLGRLRLVLRISEEVRENQHRLYVRLLIILGIIFMLLTAVLLFFERKIIHPLSELNLAFINLANKDYDYSFTHSSHDEIAELISNFKIMHHRLRYDEIEINELYGAEKSLSQELRRVMESLEISRKEAVQANQAKSAFLANMSHEIRTPMNGIINLVKLSIREDDVDKRNYYLKQVENSSELLLDIINDILDFSKIEAGKLVVNNQPFNLVALLQLIENIFSLKAEEKGIKILFMNDESLPRFLIGDDLRLKQILINLIGNAIKFTEKGSVKVHSQLVARSETDYALIKFSVTDTGIGIAKEKLPDLFNAFTQAENSTTRQFGGSGLGLSISQSLVKLLGGTLKAESEPGQGSCFYFQLPFQIDTVTYTDTGQEIIGRIIDLSGKKVLVAEDNKTNRLVMKVILEQEKIKFDMVDNGRQALESLKNGTYDAVLMDVQMPVMNGLDATEKIRHSNEAYQDIPIIAMTAYAIEGDRKKCLEAGMDAYISKPIDREDLLNTLDNLLRLRV